MSHEPLTIDNRSINELLNYIGGRGEEPQPGNRFVSFVRARGVHCLVGTSLKRDARPFPFSLCAQEAFPFPFVSGRLSLFP